MYRTISYIIGIAFAAQIAIGNLSLPKWGITSTATLGNPYIEIIGETFSIQPQLKIGSIKIEFQKPLNKNAVKIFGPNRSPNISVSPNGNWITVIPNTPAKSELGLEKIRIKLIEHGQSISINRITAVLIDNNKMELKDLLDGRTLNLLDAGISLQYPYSIRNIGYSIAQFFGKSIPYLIIVILLPLAGTQVVLTVLYIIFDPIKPIGRLLSTHSSKPIYFPIREKSIIDKLTLNIAIPLGLFGTIASLWSAFELMSFEIGNLHEILNLLTKALFTTFLGFSAYVSMNVRNFIERLSRGSDDV